MLDGKSMADISVWERIQLFFVATRTNYDPYASVVTKYKLLGGKIYIIETKYIP